MTVPFPPIHPFFLGSEERQGPSQLSSGVTSQKGECHARRMGLWWGTEPFFHPLPWKKAAPRAGPPQVGLGGAGGGFYASQPGISFREIPAFNSHPAGSFLNICKGFKEGWQQWEHVISAARCTHSKGCRNRSRQPDR